MNSYEYYQLTKPNVNKRHFCLLKAKEVMEVYLKSIFDDDVDCSILKSWAEELYANSKER